MSERKHTPGQWLASTTANSLGERMIWAHRDTEMELVGQTKNGNVKFPERVAANARLIAAAPDLLEVAKAYEQWEADLIVSGVEGPNGIPTPTPEQWDRMIEIQTMRNAAIAKATQ